MRVLEKLLKWWKGEPYVFVTSDQHLDHKNIIKYCNRPFRNVWHMNRVLIRNWNSTVRKDDTVYFLGDLAYGRGSKSSDYWLRKLNGKIIFIKGNHDHSKMIKFHRNYTIEYKGVKFYLVHRPEYVPQRWNGWTICGHVHNKRPFIDKNKKLINVSVEVTKYKPVNMNRIVEMIRQ